MAYPVIVFNASTGSDTAASGAGPAVAITGTAAAHTGGVASTTITLTGSPDLSPVATDGSAALWLKTASGRQFSKITAADNTAKTVTVEDEFTVAEISAVDYAIGGKRATLENADSRMLLNDLLPGWTCRTETDQSLTASLAGNCTGSSSSGGMITFEGSSGSIKTITQTANSTSCFHSAGTGSFSGIVFRNLKFCNSYVSTSTSKTGFVLNGGTNWFYDCVFGDATNPIATAFIRSGTQINIFLFNCTIQHCFNYGIYLVTSAFVDAINCTFKSNGGSSNPAIYANGSGIHVNVRNCVFDGNGEGVNCVASTPYLRLFNNVFYSSMGDGVDLGTVNSQCQIQNCIFMLNGGYGIQASAEQANNYFPIRSNCFYNNTSGPSDAIPAAEGDVNADPLFVNAAAGDFRLQATSPCINAGYPSGDIGAYQRAKGTVPIVGDVKSGVSYNVGGQDGTLVGTYAGGGGGSVIGSSVIKGVAA